MELKIEFSTIEFQRKAKTNILYSIDFHKVNIKIVKKKTISFQK